MEKIKIVGDFECANAEEIQQIGHNYFSLKTRADDAKNGGMYASSDYYTALR